MVVVSLLKYKDDEGFEIVEASVVCCLVELF